MNIMSIGKGFVSEHLPYENITDRLELNYNQIEKVLDIYKPDVLINCIGKTGRPNIDWCESHKSETTLANTALPIMLADVCEEKNIHLIHIGSGCIYFGQSPNSIVTPLSISGPNLLEVVDAGWKEDDFANPKSHYSKTKYACDLVLGNMNVTTLRIRMPISSRNTPRNFINKIKEYNKLIDIPNSMTFMDDLVRCVDWAAKNTKFGIYHVVNPQPLTAVQVMKEYQKYFPNHKFETINEEELDKLTAAKRSNCILNSDKLKNAGFHMTDSVEALTACMRDYFNQLDLARQ